MQAATLIVRTSCVGEALTVPVLKLARREAGHATVSTVLGRIVADESGHAQLGWWFLDWAASRFTDEHRDALGIEAGMALRAFAPAISTGACAAARNGFGAITCRDFDPVFARAARERVAEPLAARGIEIPRFDLASIGAAA